MRIVAALGGNALLRRGEKADAEIQLVHVRAAAEALAPIAAHHQLIICHGNGPQVGMLALESENDSALTRSYPLDALVAQTQGMIGYWLAQALRNEGLAKPAVGIVTQTLVASDDPAFDAPTKFVGPGYDLEPAHELAGRHGWTIAADGAKWRRVVPSPEPRGIVEQDSISRLLESGSVVICGGGGGAPVTEDDKGRLHGVEAVVDKDYVSAMLAINIQADRLLVLTDVPAVMAHFGTPQAAPLARLDLAELADLRFPAGSMGPKIAACTRFVTATGRPAAIGALADAGEVLAGTAGTTITARPGRERAAANGRAHRAPPNKE